MWLKAIGSKWLLSSMGIIAVGLMALGACSKGDEGSVVNPNPNPFKPTGSIQGVVRDRVTLEPLVNAKVTIDVASATTDSTGSFVIRNVPATEDALGTVSGSYIIQVDLRNARNEAEAGEDDPDVNMADDDFTPRYPEIVYSSASVVFTSLDDTENCEAGDCATNSSNHDTPVDGLVNEAGVLIEVGKLSCSITGTVYGGNAECPLGVAAADYATARAAEVRLESNDDSDNDATGASGNILGEVSTSTGDFSFTNVECGGVSLTLVAAAPSFDDPTEHDDISVSSPEGDGETLVLHLEQSGSEEDPAKYGVLHLCPNDDLGPAVIDISPVAGADIASTDPNDPTVVETITITFHEPVLQDANSSTDPSGVDNLYDNIDVNFDGDKGNIAYTLTWLPAGCVTNCTELQVQLETGASGQYHVRLIDMAGLTDLAGNGAQIGACPDDSAVPWAIGGVDGGTNDCTVYWTTFAGTTLDAPTVVLTNGTQLNEGSTPFPIVSTQGGTYDWVASVGAKDYVMYCKKIQVWEDGTEQEGPFITDTTGSFIDVSGSSATVDFDALEGTPGDGVAFTENDEVALQYDCVVKGVNSDLVEGPASTAVTAKDNIGPFMVSGTLVITDTTVPPNGNCEQIRVTFNEPLRESAAEVASSYTYNLGTGESTLTASAAELQSDNVTVHLTVADTACAGFTDDADNTETLTAGGAKDVAGNTVDAAGDLYCQDTGAIESTTDADAVCP
jgi:hypothetical protein